MENGMKDILEFFSQIKEFYQPTSWFGNIS